MGARHLGRLAALGLAVGLASCTTGQPPPAAAPAAACPPKCETADLSLTNKGMADLRTAAWKLLLPLVPSYEGLPDGNEWTHIGSVIPFRVAGLEPLPLKVDLLRELSAFEQPPKMDLYEATFVNGRARDFIVTQALNKPSTTGTLQAAHAREIAMPEGSQALKMFFYRVRQPEEVNVRLWDWNLVRVKDETNLDPSAMADQCVQVTPTRPGCVAAKDTFYTITVDDMNRALFTCGRECTPSLQNGDVLILIAVHITSKQTPEWLWATFWWRGPDKYTGDYWTCQDAQRPPEVAAAQRWKLYSMDAAASLQLAKPATPEPKDAGCGVPPPLGSTDYPDPDTQQFRGTYNPFVEAGLLNGLKSSCVNCHARASTMRTYSQKPPSLDDMTSPHLLDFEGHIRLDYLWSLRRGLDRTSFP